MLREILFNARYQNNMMVHAFYSDNVEMQMKQIFSRCGLLLLLTLSSLSHADETQWITDKRGCKVANIAPQEGESITWSGECKNGVAHGEGTLSPVRQSLRHRADAGEPPPAIRLAVHGRIADG